MKVILKLLKKLSKKRFYDKNGKRIKKGDILVIPIRVSFMFTDRVVKEINGHLGLFFKNENKFLPFHKIVNSFLEECEVITGIKEKNHKNKKI